MKKAFITGITGTVAPYLKKELEENGYQVFDKHFRINEDIDLEELKVYIKDIKPDVIYHLALGPVSFAETLATYAKENNIKFVYISTVSVFEDNQGGPYYKETEITVSNDYGKYKHECEKAVYNIYKESYILRIGWQMSEKADDSTNNMFRFVKDNLNESNEITVSNKFYPSVSFLDDTAKALRTTVENNQPDLYLINSNLNMSLFELLNYHKKKFNKDWIIKEDNSFSRNDIMIDERVEVFKLKQSV